MTKHTRHTHSKPRITKRVNTLVGMVSGDTVSLVQAGTFATKNAGAGNTVTANDSLTGASAGNYILTQPLGTFSAIITPRVITFTGTSVYNRTTSVAASALSISNLVSGDTAPTIAGTATIASANAGTQSISALTGLTLSGNANYTLTGATGSVVVTPKALIITGTSVAANKVYNGTTAATVTGGTLSGVISGDTVTLTQAGTFASKNVGTAIVVTANDSISGTSAANYTLTQPTGLKASITAKPITLTGTVVYSKTTTVVSPALSISNLVAGDTAPTISGSVTIASANAGTNAISSFTALTLSGNTNYTLTGATGSVVVTPKALTVSGTTAVASKVYNGTTAATVTGGTLSGVITGDTVTLTQAGTFADKNVGTGKAVTIADTIAGTSAANYTLTQPTGLTANITPKALTVTGTKVITKVYDGTTTATLTTGVLSGLITGDTVTLTQAGTFASKNVGTAIVVTANDSLSGASAGNYTLTQPAGLTGSITARPITVTGSQTFNNSTTVASTALTVSNLVAGDVLTLGGSVTIASAAIGTKAISSFTSLTLSGTSAANYTKTGATGTVTVK